MSELLYHFSTNLFKKKFWYEVAVFKLDSKALIQAASESS